MADHSGPYRIEVYVEHNFKQVFIGFDLGGGEAIADGLAEAIIGGIYFFSEQGVNDSHVVGEGFLGMAVAGEVGVGVHEVIGVDVDGVERFEAQQEEVVEFFGPIFFEEPVFVVALPGEVELAVIGDDEVSGYSCHSAQQEYQKPCQHKK